MKRILLVEDDIALGKGICIALQSEKIQIDLCRTLRDAYDKDIFEYDLFILDINLPDGSGLDYLHELREKHCSAPIIMLTANDMETDVVIGLESGADDYYYKAFFTCNPSCARECTASPRAKSRFFDLSAGAFSV